MIDLVQEGAGEDTWWELKGVGMPTLLPRPLQMRLMDDLGRHGPPPSAKRYRGFGTCSI